MSYLLDTNTFIQAKNDYYGFSLCPGFWEWLIRQNRAGKIYSIDKIQNELTRGNDALATWASGVGAPLFLPFNPQANSCMPRVTTHVQGIPCDEMHKRKFLASADPLLIAYGLAHNMTVVSQEVKKQGAVKIPSVCDALGVANARFFDMLTTEGARFVLEPPQ